MSSCHMFTLLNLFKVPIFDHHKPPNPNNYSTTWNSKSIWQNAYVPIVEYCNKWKNSRNIKGTVLRATILSFFSLTTIILFESGIQSIEKVYQIIIDHFSKSTCPEFVNMPIASIGKQGQFVNCKHLYYMLCYFRKMNFKDDKFIHSPSFSFNEVMQFLVQAQIIRVIC
jgi:hypothetical protein